jgi:hypothetical protein
VRPSGYFGFNRISSSDFSIAVDDDEYPTFYDSGLMASETFNRPTMVTNSFLLDDAQDFSSVNSIIGLKGYENAAPASVIPQIVDPSALKKRKTTAMTESEEPPKGVKVFDSFTVLNLIFKYAQELKLLR